MKPNGEDIPIEVLEIRDAETDVPQDSCPHACQQIKVRFSIAPEAGDIIRKTTPEKQDVE